MLSIVLPTHNRLHRLQNALNSVLGQLPVNAEIVVINDGSTDGTTAFLDGVGENRCQVIHRPVAGGVSTARNHAAKVATGEYLVFLDDDDAFLDGTLAAISTTLLDHPRVDYAWGGRRVLEWDGNHRLVSRRDDLHVPPGSIVMGKSFLPYVLRIATSCAFTIRRSRFLALGGFDEGLRRSEDRDLFLRLAETDAVGLGIPSVLVEYNVHSEDSLSRPSGQTLASAVDLRVIEKHRGLLHSDFGQPVLKEYLLSVYAHCLQANAEAEAQQIVELLRSYGVGSRKRWRIYLRHADRFRRLKSEMRYTSMRRFVNRASGRV